LVEARRRQPPPAVPALRERPSPLAVEIQHVCRPDIEHSRAAGAGEQSPTPPARWWPVAVLAQPIAAPQALQHATLTPECAAAAPSGKRLPTTAAAHPHTARVAGEVILVLLFKAHVYWDQNLRWRHAADPEGVHGADAKARPLSKRPPLRPLPRF